MITIHEKINPSIFYQDLSSLVTVKQLGLSHIIENRAYLDTKPPYQRGEVWKKKYKEELIKSILNGIPINTIHLVEKPGDPSYRWVLDGKQRIETLKDFLDGKFSIQLTMGNEKNTLFWNDLINNSKFHYLAGRLKEHQITVVVWKNMNIGSQKEIFTCINYSQSLNPGEKLYCRYFLTQKLLKGLFDNFKHKLSKHLNKQITDDYRFAAIKMIHNILILCYGKTLDDTFNERDLNAAKMEKYSEELENLQMSKEIDATTEWDTIVEKIPALKIVQHQLSNAVDWLDRISSYQNDISKKIENLVIVDILTFFIKKQQEKILTNSYVLENLDKFYVFLVDWIQHKNTNNKLKRRSTQTSSLKEKFKVLEDKFNTGYGFDVGVKNKSILKSDKIIAAFKAPAICPINGCVLTDDNVEFDHLYASANASESPCVAISDIANKKKSDLTLKTVDSISKYFNSNEAHKGVKCSY